jgi:hypothetical protein
MDASSAENTKYQAKSLHLWGYYLGENNDQK